MRQSQDLEHKLGQLRSSLTQNKIKQAINQISRIESGHLDEQRRLEFCRLARRARVPLAGLRSIAHVRTNQGEASVGEIIEYAACLIDLGAVEEAIERLNRSTAGSTELGKYEIARAYLILFNYPMAMGLLKDLVDGKLPGHELEIKRLLSRCYRMIGSYELAFHVTQGSAELRLEHQIAEVLREVTEGAALNALVALQSLKMKIPERAEDSFQREMDLHLAVLSRDNALFEKLYFGTPSAAFRTLLMERCQGFAKLSEEYVLGSLATLHSPRCFDLFKGVEIASEGVRLKPGQNLHRLLVALTGDCYAGISVARIYEQVMREGSFDPVSSPTRVYQLIKRLKHWFAQHDIPIVIDKRLGTYHLKFRDAYVVRLSRQHLVLQQEDGLYLRLELALPRSSFSIQEASRALGLGRRFTRRLLERGEKSGWIVMTGRGRSTMYEFQRKGALND